MKPTLFALPAGLAFLTLLASCATHPDGTRMTFSEQWSAMAARQDAAARDFVDTRKETNRVPPPGATQGSTQGPRSGPPDGIPTPTAPTW